MRIVILGCAGSGKTTLAQRLGERTGAPVISLDAICPAPLQEKDVPAFRSIVQQAHAGDNWISEGNFAAATFDIRLPRATLVIWLERSRWLCAWRSVQRTFQHDEPHEPGRILDVLKFIWNFDRINRPRIEALRVAYGPHLPVRRLSSPEEIAEFVASCKRLDQPAEPDADLS